MPPRKKPAKLIPLKLSEEEKQALIRGELEGSEEGRKELERNRRDAIARSLTYIIS